MGIECRIMLDPAYNDSDGTHNDIGRFGGE